MNVKDFLQIIDEYSPASFELCKQQMYPVMGFEVLLQEEVRPCDFKERLYHFFETNEALLLENTFEVIDLHYFILSCSVLGSADIVQLRGLPEKYANKIEECGDTYDAGKADINTLDFAVLCYLNALRGIAADGEISDDNQEIYLYLCDIDTVKYVLENITIREMKQKKGIGFKKKQDPVLFTDAERLLVFVVTMLVLIRVLQYEGEI